METSLCQETKVLELSSTIIICNVVDPGYMGYLQQASVSFTRKKDQMYSFVGCLPDTWFVLSIIRNMKEYNLN